MKINLIMSQLIKIQKLKIQMKMRKKKNWMKIFNQNWIDWKKMMKSKIIEIYIIY